MCAIVAVTSDVRVMLWLVCSNVCCVMSVNESLPLCLQGRKENSNVILVIVCVEESE